MPGPPTWNIRRWLFLLGLIGVVATFYTLGGDWASWPVLRAQLGAWQLFVQEHVLMAAGVFFLAYVGVTALSLPIAVWLTLIGGALFGRGLGTLLVDVAATCGATLAFWTSRYLFRDWVRQRLGTRLDPLNRGVARDGGYYLLTLRLVPVVPFFLINLGLGLTPMRTLTFFWVSLLGMLPGTFLFINVGSAAGDSLATLDSPRDLVSPGNLIALALLGVIPWLFRVVLRRPHGS